MLYLNIFCVKTLEKSGIERWMITLRTMNASGVPFAQVLHNPFGLGSTVLNASKWFV